MVICVEDRIMCLFFDTRLSRTGLSSLKLLIKILEPARRLLLDEDFCNALATSAKFI